MRYKLYRDGVMFCQGTDVMDIVTANWADVMKGWQYGWVLKDSEPGVKWDTWAVVYRADTGIELSTIQS